MTAFEWQPIETAIKSEAEPMVLLLKRCHPDDYRSSVVIGFWSANGAYGAKPHGFWADWGQGFDIDSDGNDEWFRVADPSHWMPLPAPPK